MLQSEFYERTGVVLSGDDFWAVNAAYNRSPLTKDEFCDKWMQDNPALVKAGKLKKREKERDLKIKSKFLTILNYVKAKESEIGFSRLAIVNVRDSYLDFLANNGIAVTNNMSLAQLHYKILDKLGIEF